MPGDIIILHLHTKNYDQDDLRFLRYGSQQMDKQTDSQMENVT